MREPVPRSAPAYQIVVQGFGKKREIVIFAMVSQCMYSVNDRERLSLGDKAIAMDALQDNLEAFDAG